MLENLGMPSTLNKAGPKSPVWASRVFTVGDRRTKVGSAPRKEGSLGFLRIILKMIPNLIFGFPCMNSVPSMSDAVLPLRLLINIPSLITKTMGKIALAHP